MSNFLIKKYKGKYTLKTEYDKHMNDFNRKLNGTYEDIDVYIQCAHKCKIFYYGNRGTLQFYCPSLQRGNNIVRMIYALFIRPDNMIITTSTHNIEKDGTSREVCRRSYQVRDESIFQKDLLKTNNIIFNIEKTDSEVLFMFKADNLECLEDILKPNTIAANRSPFSTKNLPKSDYKIPDKDFVAYKKIIENLAQNQFIKLVHISQRFMSEITKNKKEYEEMNVKKKQLGMKPKEFYHYIGKWAEYIDYLQNELQTVD